MLQGSLVKAKGGFYFVMLEGGKVVRCRVRGRLKETGVPLAVGDRVEISPRSVGDGVVEKVLPRKNSLPRPPVANVDQAVVVVSLRDPPLDRYLLHRIILAATDAGLESIICFNKIDLIVTNEEKSLLTELQSVFTACGYTVLCTSSFTGNGLAQLREQLLGKISVLAGPSGAGKSSLLNSLKPGLTLKMGTLSPKLGRGRHTTRHVELVSLDENTLVADTPGFQQLDLVRIMPRELASFFPDIMAYGGQCHFKSCLHHHEPVCAVKDAVLAEKIASWRYELYISFLEEIGRQEKKY